MATANTIESFLSLIKLPERVRFGNPCRQLHPGELIKLPPGRHVAILSGQVWLTHRGDRLDHFPSGGDSFDTTKRSQSLIQALTDSTILIK